MALNPFFLHGSPSEQRLVQDNINELLRMAGIEVIYIPRKFVRKELIVKEISSSKFDDNFAIEMYLNNQEGYTGQGDILTKFGVSLKDEVNLLVSRERFEDFISPFLNPDDPEIELSSRPREGDLIYFPLGQRLFEVKFVEHENPFYQLGKLFVYELSCELFEYEDEIIDTTIPEVDEGIKDDGYITTLSLIGIGLTASATATIGSGYIRKIYLNEDGYGFTSAPVVAITTAPSGGISATGYATLVTSGGVTSVKEIILTHAGIGYTTEPIITITGGGGVGASATCSIEKVQNGIVRFNISNSGDAYKSKPPINITGYVGLGQTAIGIASVGTNNQIVSIGISNPGIGYTQSPSVTISPPSIISGIGTYLYNEIVIGQQSGATARVRSWDHGTKILKVANISGGIEGQGFYSGELIVGSASSAVYAVSNNNQWDLYDKYGDNLIIEEKADQILDFSESNPFGIF
jgi:hypothetical protein